MSAAGKSVGGFGLWCLIAGAGLLLFPVPLLAIVQLAVAEPIYVRVIGFILIEIGILYVWLARSNIAGAYPLSVYIRLIPVAALSLFVITGMGPWQLILFAIVDAASAAHTWMMLKRT